MENNPQSTTCKTCLRQAELMDPHFWGCLFGGLREGQLFHSAAGIIETANAGTLETAWAQARRPNNGVWCESRVILSIDLVRGSTPEALLQYVHEKLVLQFPAKLHEEHRLAN